MNRSTRGLSMAGAMSLAALSLSLAPVLSQTDEGTPEEVQALATTEAMEPGLYVRDAWARESPMVQLAGAAYLVIHNKTDADEALVGASSPAARVVELHLSSMDEEGMMSMDQVTEIPIPARGEAVLEPGGYHLMLIDLVEPLSTDTDLELSLEFSSAEPQTVSVPVLAQAPSMGDMEMDMDMDGTMDGSAGVDQAQASGAPTGDEED